MEENKDKITKHCHICGLIATSLCYNCMQYFCESCFKLIHDIQNNSKHKKESIDFYVPIDLRCQEHPLIPLNLFCLEERGNYFYKSYNYNIRTLLCLLLI